MKWRLWRSIKHTLAPPTLAQLYSDPDASLLELLNAINQQTQSEQMVSASERAQALVEGLVEQTHALLAQRGEILSLQPAERRAQLITFAGNLFHGEWTPQGVSKQDVRALGEPFLVEVVIYAASGEPTGRLQRAAVERLRQAASMPALRGTGSGPSTTARRALGPGPLPDVLARVDGSRARAGLT